MAVKPIPEGYHAITPYLCVNGADQVIEFLTKAFGAKTNYRMPRPDGKVLHAEVQIGDSRIMLSEATDQHPAQPTILYHYVTDVDAVYERALGAGGTSAMEPMDMFYGDRSGAVKDPAGNHWWVATHKEEVSEQELKRRATEMFKQKAA